MFSLKIEFDRLKMQGLGSSGLYINSFTLEIERQVDTRGVTSRLVGNIKDIDSGANRQGITTFNDKRATLTTYLPVPKDTKSLHIDTAFFFGVHAAVDQYDRLAGRLPVSVDASDIMFVPQSLYENQQGINKTVGIITSVGEQNSQLVKMTKDHQAVITTHMPEDTLKRHIASGRAILFNRLSFGQPSEQTIFMLKAHDPVTEKSAPGDRIWDAVCASAEASKRDAPLEKAEKPEWMKDPVTARLHQLGCFK